LKKALHHIVSFALILASFTIIFTSHAQVTDDANLRLRLYELAFIDLEPDNGNISFSLTQPANPGLPPEAGNNNSKWINYTCCVKNNHSDRYITVAINNGSIPPGLEFQISASAYSGTGAGILGSPSGTITLTVVAQTLISGIRGAYTGNGVNNGHQLTYNLIITDYSLLDFDQSSTIQVVYTIVD
jgi:hypothetical protein